MEELHSYINELMTNNSETENGQCSRKVYRLLSQIKLADKDVEIFQEIIIPKLLVLISNKKIKRDLMYLSILPNKDRCLLQQFLNFEKSSLVLYIGNSSKLLDYCLFQNEHWFTAILQNENLCGEDLFSKGVKSVIKILKLINISNQCHIDVNDIQMCLMQINCAHNKFVEFYVNELNRVLDIVQLCQKYLISEEKTSTSDIYHYASSNSLLKTISKFVNLQSFDACNDALLKLKEYKTQLEVETFTAYIVLFNVLHCLYLCRRINKYETNTGKDEISEIIKETELKLVNLTNLSLQIEILENIFALLFLQSDRESRNNVYSKSYNFYCSENEVRLLLMFLNSTCEEIKRKNPYDKASEEFKRFTELNKYLADGLWRLELLTNSNYEGCTRTKIEENIIPYMLAPPESLIHLCLKQNDFNKARQVIQIFNLQASNMASEIEYTTKLIELKQLLKKVYDARKVKQQKLIFEQRATTKDISTLIQEFIETNSYIESEKDDNIIKTHMQTHEYLIQYNAENSNFLNVLDLAITQPNSFESCDELLNIAHMYNIAGLNIDSCYLNFYRTLQSIFTEVNNQHTMPIKEIICNAEFDLNVEKYKAHHSFYAELCRLCNTFNKQLNIENGGKLNSKHASHKTYLKLQQLCSYSSSDLQKRDDIKYLQRFFNYLKGFCKIFYIEKNNSAFISNGKDTSFFQVLRLSRSNILEKLLYKKKLDISDFEQLFTKLKLDLVYHVATIFFPRINLNIENCTSQNYYVKPINSPNNNIISYVQKRNWLLAFILSEIYKIEETKLDLNEIRIKTFINFVKLQRTQYLRALFDDNEVITALQHQIDLRGIESYFEQHIVKQEVEEITQAGILSSQVSTGSLETGREMFEGDLKITNWKHLFNIINSIPKNQLQKNKELIDIRDMVLNELVSDCFEPDFFKYVRFISDDCLRWECILNNLTTWPGEFCIEVIKSELSSFFAIDEDYVEKFSAWCEKIQLYEKLRIILQKTSWFEIFLLCKNKPQDVLQNLLNTVEVDLLLKFIEIHEISNESLNIMNESYFMALFDSNVDLDKIQDLLSKLSVDQSTQICYRLLTILKKLEYLDFVARYVSQSDLGEILLKNIQISLKILSCFTSIEQEQLWCLITDPLSIIEILIMNTKLEKLGQVLEKINPDIENCEFDENQISVEKIDEILRMYAEKSLEFRVILQPGPKLTRTPESSKLLQSLDSVNFPLGRKNFIVPALVPDKSEWVQNHEVTECMCCSETIFSMFNRRHHCRSCGRVVCGTCSLKRMQVPTYEDILVRVCLDCYEQSHQDGAGTSSSKSETSTRSVGCDYWLLTDDPNHNQIVRSEFSYEYAPSVSLCLAILKHHSKNEYHPKFLLDQCDVMLQLLQPVNSEAIQEIDYLLVIKMLKSLAIAAKMLSAQCMLQWGSSLADRILSQADLLGLLAERYCLHLIPTAGHSQNQYIDAAMLRRLRDKLLEREQWNLALEVSTKAGLDNSGVFAAWGKSYLKAGSLQLAREKFQRCFDKTAHYETSTELSDSFSSMHLSHFRTKSLLALPENRPIKNPPLLNEIIQILESNTCIIDSTILKDVKNAKPLSASTWSLNSSVNLPLQNDPAVCILNKLKNLSNIAAGNYCGVSDYNDSIKSLTTQRPHLELLFYEECIYYLTKYGSHMSLLEFYIKHGDFHECLRHMLESRLSSDTFIEIYVLCLRENFVNALHEGMSKIDSTLDVWKDYLKHICRHLEKQSKLHSLYQLQQFMGDFVRAAMTCIKFYTDDATTYMELTSRVDYLHKAQQHLQQELEQEQWVEVATVRKSNTDSQESFEAKGIANPSLVMKMDSKNVDKHINTIWRQIEITKFLAECESSGTPVLDILPEILPFINEDSPASDLNKVKIPTLFGSYYERVQLAVLAIVCGNNVEDGFGIAFRIIQDYKLSPVKVYCQAGKQLAKTERYTTIAQLVNCIRSSGISDSSVTDMCDEMLILAVQTLTKAQATGPQLDGLIKLITDRAAKISAYIESKQLKSAYLLAVKHKRMGDIRRILREAEFLNQPNIKALCQKILHAYSHSPSHSKD